MRAFIILFMLYTAGSAEFHFPFWKPKQEPFPKPGEWDAITCEGDHFLCCEKGWDRAGTGQVNQCIHYDLRNPSCQHVTKVCCEEYLPNVREAYRCRAYWKLKPSKKPQQRACPARGLSSRTENRVRARVMNSCTSEITGSESDRFAVDEATFEDEEDLA